MKSLFTFCLFFIFINISFPQNYHIQLLNNSFLSTENIDVWVAEQSQKKMTQTSFYLIQFYEIPSADLRKEMQGAGLKLWDYIPNYLYEASFSKNFDRSLLESFGVRAIISYDKSFKLSQAFYAKKIPPHTKSQGKIRANLSYHPALALAEAEKELSKYVEIISRDERHHLLEIHFKEKDLNKIAALNCVRYMEEVAPEVTLEALYWNSTGRSNWLNSGLSGLDYGGDGVSVGVHEGGIVNQNIHQEFQGRFTESGSGNISGHKTGVGNRMAGAGNLNPQNASIAREADLISLANNGGNTGLFGSVKLRSVNHSFGYGRGTTAWGAGQNDDRDIRDSVGPLHSWSAGNVGRDTSNYGPYVGLAGRANLTGGAKQGKNIFATGATNARDGLTGFSSRGPAFDGRIKPDLVLEGGGGTSHSAPKISGIVAQLVEVFKDKNTGTEPHLSMIKACLLNTCDDIENAGLDFTSGFGRVNVRKAYNTFNGHQHFRSTITNGSSKQHGITVPANVKQLRVLVHWPDYPASQSLPTRALVNDIDMTLADPSSTIWQPWILDHSPTLAAINSLATRGRDSINNVEQITIDNPAAGNFTVNINGAMIPQGPQTYFLVYEFLYDELTLTYPIGNEHFVPGEDEIIKWDSYGNTGSFDLEYSENNGASWANIATGIAAAQRNYTWTVPMTTSGQVLVRIKRGALSSQSLKAFSIMAQPTGFFARWACGGDVLLEWDPLPIATSYRITRLGAKYMDSLDVTTNPYYLAQGMSLTQSEFFSLEAYGALGARSRRLIAIEKNAGNLNCSGIDAGVIASNFADGYYPDCMLSGAIQATVQNLGTLNANNITVKYQLNGGTIFSTNVVGSLGSPQKQTLTFAQLPSFNIGLNTLKIWTETAGDTNLNNDTLSVEIISYASATVALPYTQNFDNWTTCSTAWGCSSITCPAEENWLNIPNVPASFGDSIDWRTNANGTGTTNTGPSGDHTSGNGNYLYLEGSGNSGSGCLRKTALLNSPCFDLRNYTSTQVSFWHHLFGGGIGELHLDLLTENGVEYDVIPAIIGAQGNMWVQTTVDLTAYIGQTVVLQFRGSTGNGFASDMAIDDIFLDGILAPLAASCQNINVTLDAAGNGSITPSAINNGSTGSAPLSFSLSKSIFTCADIGSNTVTLTVTDGGGNQIQCTAIVNVQDTTSPAAICQNINLQLDASGIANIAAADIDNGSNDACGIASLSTVQTSFSCADVGTNAAVLTATDNSGNSATCSIVITVSDTVKPSAICQDFAVFLNATNTASITAADIDNGSADACGIASLSVSPNTFDRTNLGVNTVTLTVTDNNGNSDTCTAQVTVNVGVGIEDLVVNSLNLYPSPTSDFINLRSTVSHKLDLQLYISDETGRVVWRGFLPKGAAKQMRIDVSKLAVGVYFLCMEDGDFSPIKWIKI